MDTLHWSKAAELKPKTRSLQASRASRMFSSVDSASVGSPDEAEEPSTLIAEGNAGSNAKAFKGNGFFGDVSIYNSLRKGYVGEWTLCGHDGGNRTPVVSPERAERILTSCPNTAATV